MLHLDLFQCPVEESDDFRVKSLVHGITVEPFGVLPGLAYDASQSVRKAGYEGKVSCALDQDVLCSRCQRLRQPSRVIPHRSKVIALRAVDADGDGDTRQRLVREQRPDRRQQYDRANATIMDIWDVATFSAGFPSGGAAKGTESGVFGSSSAVLYKGVHAGLGTGDRKRGVAAG